MSVFDHADNQYIYRIGIGVAGGMAKAEERDALVVVEGAQVGKNYPEFAEQGSVDAGAHVFPLDCWKTF